jgi:hypothetical protein
MFRPQYTKHPNKDSLKSNSRCSFPFLKTLDGQILCNAEAGDQIIRFTQNNLIVSERNSCTGIVLWLGIKIYPTRRMRVCLLERDTNNGWGVLMYWIHRHIFTLQRVSSLAKNGYFIMVFLTPRFHRLRL